MRRVRSLLVAGAAATALYAAMPSSASADEPLSNAVNCTSQAQRAWNPDDLASTQRFVLAVETCWLTYYSWFASSSHQRDFMLCMDRAVDAYKPPTYVDYMLGIAHWCVEQYIGYDIEINPKLAAAEPPPVVRAERQRRGKRRVTRSHRATRS